MEIGQKSWIAKSEALVMAKAVSPTERRLLGVFTQSMHGSVARSLSEKLVFLVPYGYLC